MVMAYEESIQHKVQALEWARHYFLRRRGQFDGQWASGTTEATTETAKELVTVMMKSYIQKTVANVRIALAEQATSTNTEGTAMDVDEGGMEIDGAV